MKKKIVLALTAVMLMASVPVWGDTGVKVQVNGQEVAFSDAKPVIVNSRTMIPLRGVFEKLGYTIEWNGTTKTATLKGEELVTITAGSNVFYADGEMEYSDVPAQIINNRLYLPLRAIGEAADMEVKWDGATKTAYIYDDDLETPVKNVEISPQEASDAVSRYFTAELLGAMSGEYDDCIEEKGYTTEKYIQVAKAVLNNDKLGLDKELKQEFLNLIEENKANPTALEEALDLFEDKIEVISAECDEKLSSVINAAGVDFQGEFFAALEKSAGSIDFLENGTDKKTEKEYKAAVEAIKTAINEVKCENENEKKAIDCLKTMADKLSALIEFGESSEFKLDILEEMF